MVDDEQKCCRDETFRDRGDGELTDVDFWVGIVKLQGAVHVGAVFGIASTLRLIANSTTNPLYKS